MRESGPEGKQAAERHREDVNRKAAHGFRQRTANDGAEPESKDVQRNREEGHGAADVELVHDLSAGRAENRSSC
jgi:hypothetical protein